MTAITVLDGEAAVRAAVGSQLGTTEWLDISADQLDLFAIATGGAGPEYFAISVSNLFLPQIVEVRGFAMGVNYGTDAVRFGSPLSAGVRMRGAASLEDVIEVKGGIQTRMTITIEVDGGVDDSEPACVIESLSRWLN